MVPARVTRLGRQLLAGGRRQVSARVARLRTLRPDEGYVVALDRRFPVTARLDAGLRLGAHAERLRESVAERLDAGGLTWWWVPRAEGLRPAVGLHVRDRPRALAALDRGAGPAWYAEALDATGTPTGTLVQGSAPAGQVEGLRLWEYVVPEAGSRFVAGAESGVDVWFFADVGDGAVECLVRNLAVGRLPAAECRGAGSVPASLAARPSSTVGFDVDVVYTWVDGADETWLRRKAEALGEVDPTRFTERAHDEARFADHDELRYSLRALEQFAPWVRHVWVVTDRQHPAWLATDDPWVTVVDHRDVWPDDVGLPTFNSHAIETCLHRIPGLAEHFVYLNDDMLIGRPLRPEQLFHPNGLGKFFWSNALVDHTSSVAGDIASTTAARNARRLLEEAYGVTFARKFFHTAASLTVSGLAELEAEFPEVVARTRQATFRTLDDVAMAGSFYLNWGYLTGRTLPSRLRYTYIDPAAPDARARLRTLERHRDFDAFCVNDGSSEETPEQRRVTDLLIREFFEAYLPVPGSFEVS